ncbi:MAG: TolC family protein [Cyclobacteriaceae bacterium]
MTQIIRQTTLTLAFIFFFSLLSLAQENTPLVLSLQESIDIALKNNIDIRRGGLQVVSSQVELRRSKADFLPSLNANTGVSYNVGRSINQFSNEFVERPVQQQTMGAQAQLPLFTGLSRINTLKQNKVELERDQEDLKAIRNAVTLNVIQAYTQILFNMELLEVAEFLLQTTELQLQRTTKLVEAGSLPQADRLQLEAQLASDELNVVNAQNDLELARLQLKQQMQLPESQAIELLIPELEVPSLDALPPSAVAVYENALRTWPELQSAELQVSSARYGLSIARAGYYPRLSMSAGIFSQYSSVAPPQIPRAGVENITRVIPTGNFLLAPDGIPGIPADTRIPVLTETQVPAEFTDNTYLNQLEFNLRRFVSVDLNIPIFNNWQVKSNVANARINLELAQLNVIDQENQFRQTIEQVYLDARAAAKSYFAIERRVSSLREAFRNTEARYEVGAIDAVDFNQSKNELNQAESDLVRAKYNYIFSMKVLDFYQGLPLDF